MHLLRRREELVYTLYSAINYVLNKIKNVQNIFLNIKKMIKEVADCFFILHLKSVEKIWRQFSIWIKRDFNKKARAL